MPKRRETPAPPSGDAAARPPAPARQRLFEDLVHNVTDYAIFLLDADGFIRSWNAGAQRIKGYSAHEAIGKHFSMFYTTDAVRRGWPDHELKTAAEVGRFEDEGWRVRKDGTQFWANVVITAVRDPDGSLQGFSKITRDLTERREHEEKLRDSEERFRLLVDGLRDYAIFMLDPDGVIASWNGGAASMTGYNAKDVLARPFEVLFRSEDAATGVPKAILHAARQEGRSEDEGWRVRRDGSLFWSSTIVTPLLDPETGLRGFAAIMRDLTERKRIEKLEESERQATNFLAMLAHELRNPLAPIRNAVSVMKLAGSNTHAVELARDVVDRQTLHLSRLVDDLLDVSRITTGKIVLRREPTELSLAVNRALEISRPGIEGRRHELHYRPLEAPMPVDGDLTRLTQIFTNLLDNAAKYTPEGGEITLSMKHQAGDAVVEVCDTGVGISRTLLPRIFDLFVQGDRTLARTEGGLGIGLALARRLVQMHGGAIEVHSEGAGHGSRFIVRLPLSRSVVTAVQRPETTSESTTPSRKVLVVDDNRDAAQTLCAYFQMNGDAVRVAYDGPTAFTLAREFVPDVALLDIGLPGMNGYELASLLRAEPRFHDTILVAVTGYGRDADRERARLSGFDHHFTKPVDPVAILEAIARPRNETSPHH